MGLHIREGEARSIDMGLSAGSAPWGSEFVRRSLFLRSAAIGRTAGDRLPCSSVSHAGQKLIIDALCEGEGEAQRWQLQRGSRSRFASYPRAVRPRGIGSALGVIESKAPFGISNRATKEQENGRRQKCNARTLQEKKGGWQAHRTRNGRDGGSSW